MADIHHTKHYYAGTERLCCRIGGGGLQGLRENIVSDSLVSVKEKTNYQMMEEDLSCVGSRAETKGLSFRILDKFMEVQIPEEGIYFYHPDHLGSASWITDSSGQAVQHMQYLPYGETKLDQRTSSYHERYTFTGKEKDSETGYYYFGARYYNPDLSLWLSVDPMADKYPSLSPYNYCAWNPMKIVDPNGEDGVIIVDEDSKKIKVAANFYYAEKGKDALDIDKSKTNTFVSNFKNTTLKSWGNDIVEALSNDNRYKGYSIDVEFNLYESSDPRLSAGNDPIGNWISVDPNRETGASTVGCNNINITPLNKIIGKTGVFDEYFSGFLKHEVGHTLGLYDRYQPEKSGAIYAAELMSNDLMYKLGGHDNTSAVNPFIRIWNSVVTESSGQFYINSKNREKTPIKRVP